MRVLDSGGYLEVGCALRYAQYMSQPQAPPSVYQLRVVPRSISPPIWRRLIVRSDTTLTDLHTIVQAAFAWNDEHLQGFRIHGRAYDSTDADTRQVRLADLRLHRGERFLSV
jgi:hypothetical protein